MLVTEASLATGTLVLRFDPHTPVRPEALVRLAQTRKGAAILPDGLRWPLAGASPLDGLGALLDELHAGL